MKIGILVYMSWSFFSLYNYISTHIQRKFSFPQKYKQNQPPCKTPPVHRKLNESSAGYTEGYLNARALSRQIQFFLLYFAYVLHSAYVFSYCSCIILTIIHHAGCFSGWKFEIIKSWQLGLCIVCFHFAISVCVVILCV